MKHRPAAKPLEHEAAMMPSLESILGEKPAIAPQPSDFEIPTVAAQPADVSGIGEMYGYGPDATSAPPTPAQQARRDALPEDPYFQALSRGGPHVTVSERALPDAIKVPKAIIAGLDAEYADSDKHDMFERGGNIVIDDDHHYSVRQGGMNSDDRARELHETPDPVHAGEWGPNSEDVGKHQTLLGTTHSHQYRHDDSVTGSFSGDDLAGLANEGERMSFIRTGKDYAMVAKTREFDAMVQAATQDDDTTSSKQKAFEAGMTAQYDGVYAELLKDGKSVREASEAATKLVVKNYHLAYYQGQGEKLKRVK